jgi:hypothetical protein
MSDLIPPPPPVSKHKFRPVRYLLRSLLTICILLAILLFAVTRPAFLKNVVLPKVAEAADVTLSVETIALRPFSSLELTGFSLRKPDGSLDLDANRVLVRYALLDILRGSIHVPEVRLEKPIVVARIPEAAPDATGGGASPKPKAAAKPLRFDIGHVVLADGNVRVEWMVGGQVAHIIDLSSLSLDLRDLRNDSPATLQAATDLLVQRATPEGLDRLLVRIGSDATFTVDGAFAPRDAKIGLKAGILESEGAFAGTTGLSARFAAELTPKEIRAATLAFADANGTGMGTLGLSGPFDSESLDADLHLQIQDIGATVLNLAGANAGFSFGDSQVMADLRLRVADKGQRLATSGSLSGKRLSVTKDGKRSPDIDVVLTQDTLVDLGASSVAIQEFKARVTQGERDLLVADLSAPTRLRWGGDKPELEDSTFTVEINQLQLSDWASILGPRVLQGLVQSRSRITIADQGQRVELSTRSAVRDLTADVAGKRHAGLNGRLEGQANLADGKQVDLTNLRAQAGQGNRSLVGLVANGRVALDTLAADLNGTWEADLAGLWEISPVKPEGLDLSAGLAEGSFRVQQDSANSGANLQAKVLLKDLSAGLKDIRLAAWGADAEVDAFVSTNEVRIAQARLAPKPGGKPAGEIALSGKLAPATSAFQGKVEFRALGHEALRPFLATALKGKTLASGQVDGVMIVSSDAAKNIGARGDLRVASLLVRSPHSPANTKAQDLTLSLQADATPESLDLKRLSLGWTETPRAKNQILVNGNANWKNPQAIDAAFTVDGKGVDLNPWQAMFAAAPTATSAPPAGAAAAPAGAPVEPAPMRWPLGTARLRANVDKLFLQGLDLAKMELIATATATVLSIDPFRVDIGGAPVVVKGMFNVGEPGFTYTLSTSVAALKLGPLVDAFAPNLKGKMSGTLDLEGDVSGKGITGPSLRKNLAGNFEAGLKDADIRLADLENVRSEGLSRSGRVLVALLRGAALALGLSPNELMHPPITQVSLRSTLGKGVLDLTGLQAVNSAMRLQASGKTLLADDIDASLIQDIPITLGIATNLAKKVRIYRDDRVREDYVELPPFIRVKGTLGQPKVDANEKVITGLILTGVTENLQIGNEQTQDILRGLGGLLSGEGPAPRPTDTPPSGNVAPQRATPAPPSGRPSRTDLFLDVLDQLQK